MFQFAPLLIGAGIGALGGLLTGKDPLKGALVGGASGGLLGGLPAGAWSGGAANVAGTGSAIASSAPTAMGVNLAPATIGAIEAPISYSLAPEVAKGAGVNLVNAPMADLSYAFNPIAQGAGMGSINNLAQYSTGVGTDLMADNTSMFDKISPYLDVRDLSGAAIKSQFQPRQQQMQAPSGQVTRGQAPQGTDVMALLKSIKQPERRRISLV